MTQFINPLADLITAAEHIAGELDCIVQFSILPKGKDGKHMLGMCEFPGEKNELIVPVVSVNAEASLLGQMEALTQGLASVVVDSDEQTEEWKETYFKIHRAYDELVTKKSQETGGEVQKLTLADSASELSQEDLSEEEVVTDTLIGADAVSSN
jgi:hypothetical protein